MGKRIVLFSDGTGNSAAKVWRTNVYRMFESVDLSKSDQISFYDDGVGTSSFLPLALLGGAFGWGLKRNVLDLYKFLCRNYSSDQDEIFAFGFSRGAFTIRVVIGLVVNQGLVSFSSEEELDQKIRAAYRAYRTEKYRSNLQIEAPFRWLWHRLVPATHDRNERPVRQIRFLGLWDTVAAYGLPIEEMTRAISRYLFPLELPDRSLDPKVQRACHAMCLDDERTTFQPVLWEESDVAGPEPATTVARNTADERISQVWFAGVHSNVGGGYPDDSLAYVPLNWMIAQATACGLRLKHAPQSDPDAVVHAQSGQDKDGRLYDSRSGLGGIYRYGPRKVADLCDMTLSKDPRDRVLIKTPKIHESVFQRIKVNAQLYAPVGLPRDYEVVATDGSIVSAGGYEAPDKIDARCAAQETIWNLVWRKRAIYFLTVFAGIYLASYPLYHELNTAGEFETPLRYVADTIRLIGAFLPGNPWFNAYAREPGWFLVIAAIVAFLVGTGTQLGAEITDRMNTVWKTTLASHAVRMQRESQWPHMTFLSILALVLGICVVVHAAYHRLGGGVSYPVLSGIDDFLDYYGAFPVSGIAIGYLVFMFLPARFIYHLRSSFAYRKVLSEIKLRWAPALFALLFIYLGLFFASHLMFTAEDASGLVCSETPNLLETRYCIPPSIASCDLHNLPGCNSPKVKPTCLTGEPACDQNHVAMCASAVPAVCGRPCTDDTIALTAPFSITNVCFATRIKLAQYQTYRLTVTQRDKPWLAFGGLVETNAGGFHITDLTSPIKKAVMVVLWPLKRSFIRPWFEVVARIGATGNDEYFLDSNDETDPAKPVVLVETIKPRRDGELFLYVNNAAFGGAVFRKYLPFFDYFYRHSAGTATVKIEQVRN